MLASQIAGRTATGAGLSTQESVWTVLASQALSQGSPTLRADGMPLDGMVWALDPAARDLTNDGNTPVEITLTVLGPPLEPPVAGDNGYAIRRDFYTLEGQPVDVTTVSLGTRLVAVVTVTPFVATDDAGGRLMVTSRCRRDSRSTT